MYTHTKLLQVELCDNLDNKIIETINFIMIKIIVFIIVIIVNFWILPYITQNEYINTRRNKTCTRHYIICCYCIMITIAINVRCRFSIDNTTDH